ncbi:MAG TPA: methyl-accepting chemotaxis protein [Solirubrobacteraceae bacterium]|nr:methyl-accepting chemotaxis protein [Solirubrobacteraceae bacterium]
MSRIRHISIGTRLALAFGLVCVACVTVALAGKSGLSGVKDDNTNLASAAEVQRNVGLLKTIAAERLGMGAEHLYMADGNLKGQDGLVAGFAPLGKQRATAFAFLTKVYESIGGNPQFDATKAAAEKYSAAMDEALKRSRSETVAGAEDRDGSRSYFVEQVKPAKEAYDAALVKLDAGVSAFMEQTAGDSQDTYTSSTRLLWIVTALAVLASIGLALLITRSVTRPLHQIRERLGLLRDNCVSDLSGGLDAMAAGNLAVDVQPSTPPIDDTAKDELGEVSRSVDAIRDKVVASVGSYNGSREGMREMIGAVTTTAATLSSASQEMAATSEEAGRAVNEIAQAVGDVAQGAERQVRSVEEAKQATEEVSHATEASAQSAQETATAAAEARRVAAEGEQAVAEATAAMRQVRESSGAVTGAMQQLSAKSEQIGGIVETITGIAGQTNLLALNAAIEAARAGEQGRGFAVVAEEVRKLAEESQEAAATIATLVEEIQGETTQAVAVVEETNARTEEGAATVEQAREAFSRIGLSVDDMTGRVDQIAAAVQQIAASAQKVQHDMTEVAAVAEESSASSEQVSASTEETSASAQEIATSAQSLASTAEELERLVGRFQLV